MFDEHDYGTANGDTRLSNVFRIGVVVARRQTPFPSVQVSYPDRGNGYVSTWLPVRMTSCTGVKVYHLPRLNETVQCFHPSGALESGVCLGANYTTNLTGPNTQSIDSMNISWSDGTIFDYDPQSSRLWMSGTASSAALQFQNAISLTSTASTITINAKGQITITSQANVVINGVIIDPNGNVTIPGTLTVEKTSQFDENINVTGNGNATGEWIDSTGSGVSAT
jgi:phage baseplate assembly protein V